MMKTSSNTIIAFTALLSLALTAASCSSPAAEKKPRSHAVSISAMQFQPSELTVNRGDTVIFINNDIVVHDVAEEGSKAWSSSPMQAGQTYSLVPTASADYYCTLHPVMKGRIMVK